MSPPVAPTAARAPVGSKAGKSRRFDNKREDILIAATELINRKGTKGATLQEVAHAVGLNTTSVTYYFPRKEALAAAVYERTLERLSEMVHEAAACSTPQERVAAFIDANVALRAAITKGHGQPLATLSEIRTLDDQIRIPLIKKYQMIFRELRACLGPPRNDLHKALLTARTHALVELVFWLPVWLGQYALDDFPRVATSIVEILEGGISRSQTKNKDRFLLGDQLELVSNDARQNFLRIATHLINNTGHRAASVAKIAEELHVTRGSFYHHLADKDELVLECFRQSDRRSRSVLKLAKTIEGDGWQCLASAISALLQIQFFGDWPLLRTTAMQSLAPTMRAEVVARSNRSALRFSGMLLEGMRDRSLRVIDPLVASQAIIASINGAYDLRNWATKLPRETAVAFYLSALGDGLFDDTILDWAIANQQASNSGWTASRSES